MWGLVTHIVPWHSGCFHYRNSIANVIIDILEVKDTCVVIILPRKESAWPICWVDVCKGVIVCIPATKANVKSSNTSAVVVDNHKLSQIGITVTVNRRACAYLLVMRPKFHSICDPRLCKCVIDHNLFSPLLPMWSGCRMQAIFGCRASNAAYITSDQYPQD